MQVLLYKQSSCFTFKALGYILTTEDIQLQTGIQSKWDYACHTDTWLTLCLIFLLRKKTMYRGCISRQTRNFAFNQEHKLILTHLISEIYCPLRWQSVQAWCTSYVISQWTTPFIFWLSDNFSVLYSYPGWPVIFVVALAQPPFQ